MPAAEPRQPVRVAVVIGKWINYGVESLLLELARRTDPKRVRFDFIIDADSGEVPEAEIAALGVGVIRIPPYQRPIQYHRHLTRFLKNADHDIVHAHMSTLCVFPMWAAWSAKSPVRVAHVHTMANSDEFAKSLMKYTLRPFSKVFPTNLACSSWQAAEWIYGRGAVSKGSVFYLPVARDLERFRFNEQIRDEVRTELGLKDRFVVGHLGRFVAQKNHAFLLRVLKEIVKLDARAILISAGDGPLSNAIAQEAASLDLEDHVIFLGRRTDPERLYQAMDVFTLPSLYEGVPGTGVEAQAAGLPLVYSKEVTSEIKLLETTIREPLESGPKRWAELVLEASGQRRKDTLDVVSGAGFGSAGAAELLTCYYEDLVAGSVESRTWRRRTVSPGN